MGLVFSFHKSLKATKKVTITTQIHAKKAAIKKLRQKICKFALITLAPGSSTKKNLLHDFDEKEC